jgi:hypothetical protein
MFLDIHHSEMSGGFFLMPNYEAILLTFLEKKLKFLDFF